MPTEISMAGGSPWGFRLSGGGSLALKVSRLTPGGKAALDGICQGDQVIAINGQQVAGLQLGELMELIKDTGDVLHLTLINPDEQKSAEEAQQREAEALEHLEEACEETLHHSEPVQEQNDDLELVTPAPVEQEPATCHIEAGQAPIPAGDQMTKQEWYALPTYIRDQVKPRKPLPDFKKQVKWLHGKLRLEPQAEGDNQCNIAGQQLRNAVMAHQGPIEINSGPINGKIRHSQYNTPLNIYSDPQIVTTLLSQAVASGAEIQDASYFQNTGVKVDTGSTTYKRVNEEDHPHHSKQSRSFNILTTLLKHPYEA